MEPYRTRGKVDPGDAVVLLLASVVAGVAVGAVAHYLGKLIYLIVLFPLGMGFLVGTAAVFVVKARKIQAPLIAAALAVIGGVVAWGSDMAIDYVEARGELRGNLEALLGEMEAEMGESMSDPRLGPAVDAAIDQLGASGSVDSDSMMATLVGEALEFDDGTVGLPVPESSAMTTFVNFYRFKLNAGTSISRGVSSGVELDATWTGILWIVEILLVAGFAGYLVWQAASEPLCAHCESWYPDGEIVPVASGAQGKEVAEALARSDVQRLVELRQQGELSLPLTGLRVRNCPSCESEPSFVQVVEVQPGRKEPEEKVVRTGVVPRSLVAELLSTSAPR